jgi:hypothetical protein
MAIQSSKESKLLSLYSLHSKTIVVRTRFLVQK